MDRLYDRKIYAARLPMEDLLFWAANVEIIPNLRGIMTAEELALEIRKLLLVEGNMSETRATKLAGMSQQNFNEKLKSGTLRYLEVAGLLDELGYEITWRKKDP